MDGEVDEIDAGDGLPTIAMREHIDTIEISWLESKKDNRPKRAEVAWSSFAETLGRARSCPCTRADCRRNECTHKNGKSWSPAIYPPKQNRGNKNVDAVTAHVLDGDHLTDERLAEVVAALASYQYVAHASHSDRPGDPSALCICDSEPGALHNAQCPRRVDRCVRFVLALSRPVTRDEHPRFWSAANAQLGLPADPSTRDAARMYYLPSRQSDAGEPYYAVHDGAPLDVDAILSRAPAELSARRVADDLALDNDGIAEAGKRHGMLKSLAGAMRSRGAGYDEIHDALARANERRCRPPKPDDEIRQLAQWAAKQPSTGIAPTSKTRPGPNASRPDKSKASGAAYQTTITQSRSDVQVARRACELLGTVVASEGSLWRLDGALWRRVTDDELDAKIIALDGVQIGPRDEIALSDARVRGLKRRCVSQDAKPDHFSEPRQPGLAVGDQWVSITDQGELVCVPLTADHRARWRIDAAPGDLDREPAQWVTMLRTMIGRHDYSDKQEDAGAAARKPICQACGHEMLSRDHVCDAGRAETADMIQALGECLGLGLIGRGATRDARHALIQGPPNSGKSTLLAIIEALVPAEARTALTLHDLTSTFRPASLAGVTLVTCAELPARDLIEAERVKSVLTGDPIPVERKHRDPFTLWPRALWMISTNELPAAPDTSGALARRFLLFELHGQFAVSSTDYAAKILAAERGAIVGWALRCAAAAIERGSRFVPDVCRLAAEDWIRGSDSVASWLRAATIRDSDNPTSLGVLWAAYRDYTTARGGKPAAEATLKRKLQAAGIRGMPRHGYPLRLIPTIEPPSPRRTPIHLPPCAPDCALGAERCPQCGDQMGDGHACLS